MAGLAVALVVGDVVELPWPVALLVGFGWLNAAMLGVVLLVMARTRRVRHLVGDAPVTASWPVGWPPRRKRVATVAGIGLLAGGVAALVAGIAIDHWLVRAGGQVSIPLATGLVGLSQPHRFQATPLGLVRKRPVDRTLSRWDDLACYEVTDEALVIRREGWYRPALRWDRAAIEDLDGVLAALDEHLPRTSS